jgi:hypothetical protein
MRTVVEFAGKSFYVIKNEYEKYDYIENHPDGDMLV